MLHLRLVAAAATEAVSPESMKKALHLHLAAAAVPAADGAVSPVWVQVQVEPLPVAAVVAVVAATPAHPGQAVPAVAVAVAAG